MPRLTQLSPRGGCACKLPQEQLGSLLQSVVGLGIANRQGGSPVDPNLLIGLDQPDDAAVYRIDAERALVVTCDFITPVLDDPYDWGRAAATNAVSDVYAMGGRPLLALNITAWPEDLPATILGEVLRGGAAAVGAAGAIVAGGHTIVDPVPKYGLAVVGEVDPARMLTKSRASRGDLLVITKPLGIGVATTAMKRGVASPDLVAAATATMTQLNAAASAASSAARLQAGTDITGYGLLGHLHEMLVTSRASAQILPEQVPALPGVLDLIADGTVPDGSRRNLDHALAQGWFVPGELPFEQQLLFADAQTSGGLLLAVPPGSVADLLADLRDRGVAAAVVGEVSDEGVAGTVSVGEVQGDGWDSVAAATASFAQNCAVGGR